MRVVPFLQSLVTTTVEVRVSYTVAAKPVDTEDVVVLGEEVALHTADTVGIANGAIVLEESPPEKG